ncbi:hypothetical protein DSO57_1024947 [Entomophthora muscae]|uniref:Uncharacterized protein n=1 Tax=Entomophthora muscae TaxID=34485 RepID=A0ACC2RH86_9FUNG|nr:hypothetical protein DSO57_1024947 [Entomophthora muscae]
MSKEEPQAVVDENAQDVPKISEMRFRLLMLGLIMSIFISSLDNTIVSTALTAIASEFNALNQVTWVVASYLLTSTAMQPLYGKLSDIFGRKLTILFALLCFLVGSAFCGAATSSLMLVIFRAVSGIGGGGLFSLSVIIISDIVPLKDRAIYMGLVGSIFALASIAGPLVGGAFTDDLTWRWAFYINIPILLITIITVCLFLDLPKPEGSLGEKMNRIDFVGAFLLVLAVVCAVLGLSWGGNEYEWNKYQVILPLCLGVVLFALFLLNEFKTKAEPIIPMSIFNRNIVGANLISFFYGALGMVIIYYLPIYYQVVKRKSSTRAGLELLPMLLGSVFCNIVNGIITTRTGIYRSITRLGTLVTLVGIILMGGLFRSSITRYEELGYVLVIGLGIGLCYQNNTIISQAAAKEGDIAVVTSLVFFSNLLGGVIGVAIQGAIFINALTAELSSTLPNLSAKDIASSLKVIQGLTTGEQELVNQAYFHALKVMFLSMIPYAVFPCFASAMLKHIPLRGHNSTNVPLGH